MSPDDGRCQPASDTAVPSGRPSGDPATELRAALARRPRTIPPRWLYDDRGSELFTEITRLPEYYQTEAERLLLADSAAWLAETSDATAVIELGSGTSDKTRTLLDAFVAHGEITTFVPLDVSEATLLDAASRLGERYPDLDVRPVVGDFRSGLGRVAAATTESAGHRLVLFLGGTIGNFYVEERHAFLGALADVLDPGDMALIGIDTMKPIERIIAAYDDSAGVTEAFIRNALDHINREFDGDIDAGAFEYVPFWDPRHHRVDMRLRAAEPSRARLEGLDLDLDFGVGEEIGVEISTKFRPEWMIDELTDAGFSSATALEHPDFAVILAQR